VDEMSKKVDSISKENKAAIDKLGKELRAEMKAKEEKVDNWLLFWLSILRFSEPSQFAEAAEGFRTTFL